ncbi:hypothetical protein NDK47_06375 [Brevibacillus ruminantium]|uniref:Transcriptional regulator n=1 Tax=Brevibacillus ruminantium TaxID=2950604 RepID=A0ABY4WIP6_9BACL|nr:hypothetical protein [Brevibacillus ruminantium]USG66918.1 hypothetical protein NDK47_06375 [Brevibacillus ruminantium]
MLTRVGVVGPRDSVQLICEVGAEFQDQMMFIPYVYQNTAEAMEIVNAAEDSVDIWLFSGQSPYAIAKDHIRKKKAFYPQLQGTSLTRILLEAVYRDRRELERISFDTIPTDSFQELCVELNLPFDQIHLFSYRGFMPSTELVAFHTELYAKGKVEACATCISSVYNELQAQGIPVYRVYHDRMAIRTMLQLASQQGEALHYKKSQIAVQVVAIQGLDRLIGENKGVYEVHRLELKLQEIILDYVEAHSGAGVPLGNGKHLIFSTRGSFEDNRRFPPSSLIEKIWLLADLPTYIGVGFGATALAAEKNAQLALLHAQKMGDSAAILVNDEGQMEGPLRSPGSITYEYRTDNKEMSLLLRKAGVTITTYNKILSIQKNLGKNSISSTEIAEWLGMTQRNARRILSDLEQSGLAELTGEEAPASRGRPRKVYRLVQPF